MKDAAVSGVRWLVLTRIVSESVAVIATVALARLLAPAEFGRAAVALIFVPLAGILTFEGFASALVQREAVEDTHRSPALLTSLVGGFVLSALAFGLSRVLWARCRGRHCGARCASAC